MEINSFLKQHKDKRTGQDLHEHLCNILGKILLDNPKNAFEAFEDYSHIVKQSGFSYKDPLKGDTKQYFRENYEEIKKFAEDTMANLGVPPLIKPE